MIEPTGEKIQVKSLSNSIRAWKNGHEVSFEQCRDADSYALVIFEDAALKAILIFPKCTIKDVYKALKKRHAKPDSTLQFMQANLHTILGDRETFQGLGMRIFDFATDSMTHCP